MAAEAAADTAAAETAAEIAADTIETAIKNIKNEKQETSHPDYKPGERLSFS
jgi:hypothetical protein